jgi:curved DNA-binding protein
MDFKDYYRILGVPPNAEKKYTKQTYRQLARKFHPDLNPSNKEAKEKIKTINEAYQVLSNVDQLKKYDVLRAQYQQWQQTGERHQDFDWQNWSAQPGKGARVQYANPEDLEDLFGSASPYSDFFTSFFGQARRNGRGSDTCEVRRTYHAKW